MSEKIKRLNRNRHDFVLARKAVKRNRLGVMVDTLKELGKNKKQIILALIKSGAKTRDARKIYKEAA